MRRSSAGERHYPMRVRTSEMNCRSYFSSKHFWSILVVVKMGDRAVPPFLVQIDITRARIQYPLITSPAAIESRTRSGSTTWRDILKV